MREFHAYLEERTLATTGAFTITDALALTAYQGALERMRQIVDAVNALLLADFTPREHDATWGPRKHDPLNFWRAYKLDSSVLSDEEQQREGVPLHGWSDDPHCVTDPPWLEWHARDDGAREHPRGEPVFGAGVTMFEPNAFPEEDYGEWLRRLAGLGFEYTPGIGSKAHRYLSRYLYPAELVRGADLHEQSQSLYDWVVDCFKTLAREYPAPDSAPRQSSSL